jgi:molybdenum cofactor biosynthesis protein B
MAYEQHIAAASADQLRPNCAVVTLSDTRDASTDTSGRRIAELLHEAGCHVASSHVIPDDPQQFRRLLDQLLDNPAIDVILTNGGTGVSRRDSTIPVIEGKLTTPLPGFGELFRVLSWDQIGSGAMLSRAAGGVANGTLLFAMPGSTKAVELAMTKLILPELKHLLHELRK